MSKKYVALGDSLTEANPGFVNIVAKGIGASETFNHGVSGHTSSNLLSRLKTNGQVRESLANATDVTITIGSNDIYYDIIADIAAILGCDASWEGVMTKASQLQAKFNNAGWLSKILLGFQMASIVTKVRKVLYDVNNISQSSSKFKTNLKNILSQVKSLAPNASIYVANLYNPYLGTNPIMVGSYKVFDIAEVVGLWEASYNKAIKEIVGSGRVVDINSVIKSQSQLLCDTNNNSWDPHPTAAGYRDIANAFLKVMK